MEEIKLNEWFDKTGYNWRDDYNDIGIICYYTKTRIRPDQECELEDFQCSYGCEQPFFVKSVIDWIKAENFFEIGTGRGTASFSVALTPSVKKIFTIDIRPYTQKYNYAIGYKPLYISMEDLCNMIPYNQKSKIEFKTPDQLTDVADTKYDVCFIDGNHSDYNIVMNDFKNCLNIMKDDGIIIWDDYDPNKFVVKKVIEDVINTHPEFNTLLVSFRGHLFQDRPMETGAGEVIMTRRKLL